MNAWNMYSFHIVRQYQHLRISRMPYKYIYLTILFYKLKKSK